MPFHTYGNTGDPDRADRIARSFPGPSPASRVNWDRFGQYVELQQRQGAERDARRKAEAEQAELDRIEAEGGLAAVIAAELSGTARRPDFYPATRPAMSEGDVVAALAAAVGAPAPVQPSTPAGPSTDVSDGSAIALNNDGALAASIASALGVRVNLNPTRED